jgi:hypothetical protein
VERSDNHVEEFGENIEVIWKPDASAIVVHVKKDLLIDCFYILKFFLDQKQLLATLCNHFIRSKIIRI